ncbi:hypothetical protein BGLCM_0942 [Bifidobacterium gallicum DSM 20093 = LMG 11596]|nr:hypothetical protein BGLCM_0942 [Bifidobacterium gallicum DSM 20093 = LMG 11596]
MQVMASPCTAQGFLNVRHDDMMAVAAIRRMRNSRTNEMAGDLAIAVR